MDNLTPADYVLIAIYIWCGISFLSMFVGSNKIEPAEITEWITIDNEDQLWGATADVYSTPFGNVGQHIGYRISEKARRDMKNWDFSDKLEVAYVLNHPRDRIDIGNVTFDDIGGDISPKKI